MRKFVLFSMFGLLLANCTNQEPMANNDDVTAATSNFLSVSILSANTMGTRAAENGDYTPDGDGTYRDGTAAESEVKSVLFLFFNKNGQPAIATKENGAYQTYYLWNKNIESDGKDHDQTVETILTAKTINIVVPQGTERPAQLFVVVNPPSGWEAWVNFSMNELRTTIADFETGLTSSGKFVMTNSVYVDENKSTIVDAVALSEDNYQTTADLAQKHPVIVYAERILARIDLTIDINAENNPILIEPDGSDPYYIYYTGQSVPEEGQDSNEDVYVRFLGWNVFSTPNKSRLIKHVDEGWDNKELFGYNGTVRWNSTDYHRSFWAINPPKDQFSYKFGSFTDGGDVEEGDFENDKWTADHQPIAGPNDEKKYTTAYFQENAAPYENVNEAPAQPSKVIIAAQLVNKDGTPRELAKWAGKSYTVEGLKNNFANTLNIWRRTEKGETEPTYTKIRPEDLTFKPAETGYKVNVVLSESVKGYKWFEKIDENTFNAIPVAVDEKIAEMLGKNSVMIWTKGHTFFYFDIRHLGAENTPGYYGIVRNHIYDAKVTSVSGLGTPVYDEEDDIPDITPPEEEAGILAAQIRILSWRVVSQNYELTW